jgi:hypothetical protein
MTPGKSKKREKTARELYKQAARNSYRTGHHEADQVPAKHKLAPKTIHEQDSILKEYIR